MGAASRGSPYAASETPSAFETRGDHEATKFAFNEFGKAECRAIFEVRTDDLNTNREAGLGFVDRYGGCGQAYNGGDTGPDNLVEVGVESAVFLCLFTSSRSR